MKNKTLPFILSIFFIITIDQLTKWWGRKQGIVIYNEGISFGIGLSQTPFLFGLISIAVLCVLFFLLKQIWQKDVMVFGFLCGAALSNVSDRIFFQGVQDFLPIPFTQLKNNLADWIIFICLLWVARKAVSEEKKS